ncbi:MAG TPA: DUF481 domain-containing protein [Vicinamibacterales bacterium]|nr:DUF481 domain-containing protein [Vicinamibacterales bacterium]
MSPCSTMGFEVMVGRLPWMSIVALMIVASAPAVRAADKTDVVVLKVGDRITCEIKELERGRLTVKTDASDTITVHWGHVVSLTSGRSFEVELASGVSYVGSLSAGAAGMLVVGTAHGDERVSLADVVHLAPLEQGFWRRLDGSIDLGFSYTQASQQTQWTLNADAQYRRERYLMQGSLSSQFTAIEGADSTSRNTLTLSARRFLGTHWFDAGFGQLQQDQSLGLNLRSVLGAAAGRYLLQRSQTNLAILGGAAYTRERYVDEPSDNSAEALLGVQVNWFTVSSNDTDLASTLMTYYNMSGRSRVRLDFTTSYQQKIVKDLHWSLNAFDSYDGAPPDGQKSNNSGVTISLGWSF